VVFTGQPTTNRPGENRPDGGYFQDGDPAGQSGNTNRPRVRYGGVAYPAEPVAKGAAYEIFTSEPVAGFLPNPRPGARKPYRRFVPATEVEVVEGQPRRPLDGPLVAPLSRSLSWPTAHRMTQSPQGGNGGDMVAKIRGSATISRGTRTVKILSGKQLAGYLHGWLPQGFC